MQHFSNCRVDPISGRALPEEREAARVRHLAVAGMGCPNCGNRVRNALLGIPGIVDVEVDVPGSLATVWYADPEVDMADLVDAVAEAGRGTHHRYLAVPVRSRFP